MASALSITYLGAVLCYVASPKSASGASASIRDAESPGLLRVGGVVLLGLGLGLSAARGPVGEGILVWLSMGMLAFSLLVIAAPFINRFIPVSSGLALLIAVLAPWL